MNEEKNKEVNFLQRNARNVFKLRRHKTLLMSCMERNLSRKILKLMLQEKYAHLLREKGLNTMAIPVLLVLMCGLMGLL